MTSVPIGTQLAGALRRPASEQTLANKEQAISHAAYRALVNVLPVDTNSVYFPLMKQLGYDPNDNSTDIETPTGIGNVACAAVLEYRHHDKSNQNSRQPFPYRHSQTMFPATAPTVRRLLLSCDSGLEATGSKTLSRWHPEARRLNQESLPRTR